MYESASFALCLQIYLPVNSSKTRLLETIEYYLRLYFLAAKSSGTDLKGIDHVQLPDNAKTLLPTIHIVLGFFRRSFL